MHLVHDWDGREGHEVLEPVPNELDREKEGDRLVGLPENRRVPEISPLSTVGEQGDKWEIPDSKDEQSESIVDVLRRAGVPGGVRLEELANLLGRVRDRWGGRALR